MIALANPLSKVSGAIPWAGGKGWLVPTLLRMLPAHRCYCEVFGGGAALLLNKPRSGVEVYNDANDDLVRLFRCARFHRDALIEELEWVLNSRTEFGDFAEHGGVTDIQQAARWFYRISTCFGGSTINSFGVSKVSGGAAMGSRISRLNKLAWLNQRLDRVCIENLDWKNCLDRYDGPETLFFLDPPYTNGGQGTYRSWGENDMGKFADRLKGLKGRWLLTVNDSGKNRALFAGNKMRALVRSCGIENRARFKKHKTYRELLVWPAKI